MIALLLSVGGFEWWSSILIGASNRLEQTLRKRVSDATFKRALLTGGLVSDAQPLTGLTSLRQFLTGNGLFAFFDAPWFPIYIFVMFSFHPWFGIAGILCGAVMVVLAFTNNSATDSLLQAANEKSNQANSKFQRSLRNSEVVAALGMSEDVAKSQNKLNDEVLEKQTEAAEKLHSMGCLSHSIDITILLAWIGRLSGAQPRNFARYDDRRLITPWTCISAHRHACRNMEGILWPLQYNRLKDLLERIPSELEKMICQRQAAVWP